MVKGTQRFVIFPMSSFGGQGEDGFRGGSSYRSDPSRRHTTFREDMNSVYRNSEDGVRFYEDPSEPRLPLSASEEPPSSWRAPLMDKPPPSPSRDYGPPPLPPSNSSREFTRLRGGYESDRDHSGGATYYSFRPSPALPSEAGYSSGPRYAESTGSRPISPYIARRMGDYASDSGGGPSSRPLSPHRSLYDQSAYRPNSPSMSRPSIDPRASSPLSTGYRREREQPPPPSRYGLPSQPSVTSPTLQRRFDTPLDRSSRPMSPYTPQEPNRYAASTVSSRSTSSEFPPKPTFPISEDLARAVMSQAASEDDGFHSESGSYHDRTRFYQPVSRQYSAPLSHRDRLPSSGSIGAGLSLREMNSSVFDEPHDHHRMNMADPSLPPLSENYAGSEFDPNSESYRGRSAGAYDRMGRSHNRSGSAIPEGVSRSVTGVVDYDADYYSEAESQARSFRSRENSLTPSMVNGYYSDAGGGREPRRPFRRAESGMEDETPRFDDRYRRNTSTSRPRPTLAPAHQQVYPSRPPPHSDSVGSMNVAFGSASSLSGREDGGILPYHPPPTKHQPEHSESVLGSPSVSLKKPLASPAPRLPSIADNQDETFPSEPTIRPSGSSSDSLTLEIDAIRHKVDDLRQKFMSARNSSKLPAESSKDDVRASMEKTNESLDSSAVSGASPLNSPASSRPPSAKRHPPVPAKPPALRGGSGSAGKPSPISTTEMGPNRNGPISASVLAMSTSPSTLAELNSFDDTLKPFGQTDLRVLDCCLVRNLRHTLALTLDVNQMLAEASETGMTASATSLVKNMSDVQVSSMSMLLRMMEQYEKEQKLVLDAIETGSTSVTTATPRGGPGEERGGFHQKVQQITPAMSPDRR
ncbi:hypothetical protein BC829DRAFT_456868 [Chytridium lagenaria]|nr:hypothetical protein BC829DRAFT_456868 [Chytridium lagenaria]